MRGKTFPLWGLLISRQLCQLWSGPPTNQPHPGSSPLYNFQPLLSGFFRMSRKRSISILPYIHFRVLCRKYSGFFLTVRPDFCNKMKKKVAANQCYFVKNFLFKIAARWLSRFYLFSTENTTYWKWGGTFQKHPVYLQHSKWLSLSLLCLSPPPHPDTLALVCIVFQINFLQSKPSPTTARNNLVSSCISCASNYHHTLT